MNWFMSKVISKVTFGFRVLQFLLLAYLAAGFVYWILALGKFIIAGFFEPFYTPVVDITKSLAQAVNWNIGEGFPMLHPDIFCSLILILIALIISNLLFVGFGEVEKKFVEQSYDKGEKDYK